MSAILNSSSTFNQLAYGGNMNEELVVKVAKTMYGMNQVLPLWDKEQEHLRGNYKNQARNLMVALEKNGLAVVEAKKEEVRQVVVEQVEKAMPFQDSVAPKVEVKRTKPLKDTEAEEK